MKNYEKDLVYCLIGKSDYLEKAYDLFFNSGDYSVSVARDKLRFYLESEIASLFRNAEENCPTGMFVFYIHLKEDFNYNEMVDFVIDFYK